MVLTLFVFLHLLATCAAIGTLLAADLRLVARLLGYRVVITRPERFETVVMAASLVVLYASGIALIALGLAGRPDYLANGKLQGKLVLVAILTINAGLLHARAFPILSLGQAVSQWSPRQVLVVAFAASLSNSLWFLCAFLGIARHWNHQVSAAFVLGAAAAVWLVVFLLVRLALHAAGRDAPRQPPDRLDALIARAGRLTGHAAAQPAFVRSGPTDASANQQHYGRRIADRRAAGRGDRRVSRP